MLRTITLALAAAASASAFLIPSTVSKDAVPEALRSGLLDPSNRVIKLDCRNCPFKEGKNDKGVDVWSQDVQNSLVLDFKIPEEQPSTLTINEVQIFPAKIFTPKLLAPQIPSIVSLTTFATENADDGDASSFKKLQLGFELAVESATKQPEHSQFEILNVHFKVLELGGIFVKNLDSVDLTLLRDRTNNKLMIAQSDVKPSPINTDKPVENAIKECRRFPLLCKWKAMIAAKLAALKASVSGGCGGWRFVPAHKGGRHNMTGKHGGHRHGHYLQKAKRIIVRVLFPIFIGIAAGMTASLLGMMVGHLIVLTWRTFARRGQKGQYVVVEQVEPEMDDDEKVYLPESELPAYEEVAHAGKEINEKQ